MSLAAGLNWVWMRSCMRERRAFDRDARDVAQAQSQVLRNVVSANSATEFGRRYGFDAVRSPRDFTTRVPIGDYESHRPWIDLAAQGVPNVLTREPVRLLQPTSGTTSAEKLIPYTPALRAQFQRGISTWIGDLYAERPAVRRGSAYWSISPATHAERQTAGGVRIGFDDDDEYLNPLGRFLLRYALAVPSKVASATDLAEFRLATLRHLLAASDLSLISIWSPSFLTVLFSSLNEHWEQLCSDLHHMMRRRRRAEEAAAIFRASSSIAERTQQLWPKLALVSCWADAAAAGPFDELRSMLPHVDFQPKGLLATEGFVSLPLCGEPAAALAIRSHFFEFIPVGASATKLAHELDVGERCAVVITTAGGLYRYQLYDEIEVVGMKNECPQVRFMGKTDRTSDLVGEKLAEPFVRHAISQACCRLGIAPRFALTAPVAAQPPRYRLFLQADCSSAAIEQLAIELDALFKANPYYRHAVELGQLAPLDVAQVRNDVNAQQLYCETMAGRGQRLGGVKPSTLDRLPIWTSVFAPHVIQTTAGTHQSKATRSATRAAAPPPHR